MHITAKVDYAVRALVELSGQEGPIRTDDLASSQQIPIRFLRTILADLKRSGLILSQSGAAGGFRLGRSADEITLAQVIRAVEGPLAEVRGRPPEALSYPGRARALQSVWIAVRANLRAVLDHTSIAQVASGELPEIVEALAADPAAWEAINR